MREVLKAVRSERPTVMTLTLLEVNDEAPDIK